MIKRVKKRYVAFSSEPKASPNVLFKAILSSYRELFGITGLASADLKPAKSYQEKGVVIVRCVLTFVPHLLLAASSITSLNGNRAAVRALAISGTMKRIKEKVGSV